MRASLRKEVGECLAELVEALKETEKELSNWHGWQCSMNPAYPKSEGSKVCLDRIARARAAIAKAGPLTRIFGRPAGASVKLDKARRL